MLNVVLQMASQGATPKSFILESVVRGHHIYKQTWTPFLCSLYKSDVTTWRITDYARDNFMIA